MVAAAVNSPAAARSGSDGAAVAAASASNCPTDPPPFIKDSFPQPAFRASANGILSTTLTADMVPVNINGQMYVSSVYEKSYPGPTLMVCPGDTLKVAVRNNLTAADFPSYQSSTDEHVSELAGVTNLHTHGFFVSPHPPQDDVFVEIQPGGDPDANGYSSTYDYRYDIPTDHRPGAYWYHPHVHTQTNVQESGGMAGAIIMQGGLDKRRDYRDIGQRVLVITQTALNDNAIPPATVQPQAGGRLTPPGAQFFVNGYLNPTIPIRPGEIQRWSIFNLTSNTFVKLKLQGQSFQLLARDGNYVPNRVTEPTMLISPSSRREVLVSGGTPGEEAPLTAEPFNQFAPGPPDPAVTAVPLATLKTGGSEDPDTMPPKEVKRYPDLRNLKVKSRHRIVYSEDENNLLINGQVFDPTRIDQVMTRGELSEWTIVNKDDQWHTFHIHINDFQVVEEDGKRVKRIKQEDNVSVPPMVKGKPGTIKMLYLPKRFTGKFVFHCHILGHEDAGMMGTAVVDP